MSNEKKLATVSFILGCLIFSVGLSFAVFSSFGEAWTCYVSPIATMMGGVIAILLAAENKHYRFGTFRNTSGERDRQ